MADRLIRGVANDVILRIPLLVDSTGAGQTGLTSSSSGLKISTITDNEASPVTYTQAGSTIEGITTLGTYQSPTSTKCRFKEVDATNQPGLYEIHLADARYNVSGSTELTISISGVSGLRQCRYVVALESTQGATTISGLGTTPAISIISGAGVEGSPATASPCIEYSVPFSTVGGAAPEQNDTNEWRAPCERKPVGWGTGLTNYYDGPGTGILYLIADGVDSAAVNILQVTDKNYTPNRQLIFNVESLEKCIRLLNGVTRYNGRVVANAADDTHVTIADTIDAPEGFYAGCELILNPQYGLPPVTVVSSAEGSGGQCVLTVSPALLATASLNDDVLVKDPGPHIKRVVDLYQAQVKYTRDQTNASDEYTVLWHLNGAPITSGITSPTIQVVKRADGTNLISSTSLTQVGSTGVYKLDVTGSQRLTTGEAAIAILSATIGGQARTSRTLIGRDS